jgi:hypothetical protein
MILSEMFIRCKLKSIKKFLPNSKQIKQQKKCTTKGEFKLDVDSYSFTRDSRHLNRLLFYCWRIEEQSF